MVGTPTEASPDRGGGGGGAADRHGGYGDHRTGVRTEYAHASGYSGSSDSWDLVTWNPGSCGLDVTVDYDDRLQSTTPPYLLRFTDTGWERGESTEVTTPGSVRS